MELYSNQSHEVPVAALEFCCVVNALQHVEGLDEIFTSNSNIRLWQVKANHVTLFFGRQCPCSSGIYVYVLHTQFFFKKSNDFLNLCHILLAQQHQRILFGYVYNV